MLGIGLLMIVGAIGMVVGAFVLDEAARPGLLGGAVGLGAAGAFMAYLGWPEPSKAPAGMARADAFVLDARLTDEEAAGTRVVELTLEVRPKGGTPFQVRRKFVGSIPRIEQGRKLAVHYDPADPERVELA